MHACPSAAVHAGSLAARMLHVLALGSLPPPSLRITATTHSVHAGSATGPNSKEQNAEATYREAAAAGPQQVGQHHGQLAQHSSSTRGLLLALALPPRLQRCSQPGRQPLLQLQLQ